MNILENKNEVSRLHWQYNSAVKDEYMCSIDKFRDWLADSAHEMYIEIPGNETLSGHAEILDW